VIKRDAFLYLDGKDENFAQCASCRDWIYPNRCVIHGPKVETPARASCGLYVKGPSVDKDTAYPMDLVTPKQSGLVNREVRCENCVYGDVGWCKLFASLNKGFPHLFDLDPRITRYGCCNAQTPK
jgi:hypothetical protein